MNENSEGRQSHLSATKHLLFQKWKQGQLAIASRAYQAIPRRQQYSPIPLSFAQQRLWFIDQLVEGNRAYNVSFATRIQGHLSLSALEGSLNGVVQRHEALRTTFPVIGGQPMQVIAPSLSLRLPLVDLQALPTIEKETIAQHLILEETNHVFDLAQGPLIRSRLLRLAQNDHILFLMLHHTICDGWSLGILDQELWTLYSAYIQELPSPLPELPIQYADFAIWQRQHLQGENLETQLNYWKQTLAGSSSLLQLPTDRPRPSVQTFHGTFHPFEIPENLTRRVKALSQNEGITLFMTLLAAFQLLLAYYSGQDDILVGTPVANRPRVETEKLIGFFASTLVLRTNLSGISSFRDLLGRVREVTLGAYTHQDIPFEQLVAELHVERDMSKNPLFQIMFNFGSDIPMQSARPHDLLLEVTNINGGTAMFDLWLSIWEEDKKLKGIVEFNTDLFDLLTIKRMLGHFQYLLEIVTVNPDRTLDFSLLTPLEQRQMVVEWNATDREYLQNTCLHQLFETQVEQTPDAIAVVFEDHYLTYSELDKRANQLAHYLHVLGVKPERLIGLYIERSLEMIVGVLGILKSGGAYVPLDPTYPQERLAFMIDDAQVSILLTQRHLGQHITGENTRLIFLDTGWPTISSESMSSLTTSVQSENVAYVIYTSGSTGKPKGVMNSHCGICNRLLWMQEAYKLLNVDRVLQKTPFSFDVSVWEFFWPLLSGATLVVSTSESHRDSVYLAKLIAEQQITTVHFVPSMLDIFLRESELEQCSNLRRVISSGEALPFETQERFFASLSKTTLYNLYGPTEAAVDVTHWTCVQKESESKRRIVPIGYPIANIQIYLLDRNLNPVPVGVAGELHIGGVGLARGYLDRPDITAERFIPHPFSPKSGARLYKTGDIARYLPDGCIEFLGRLDHQVKLRGFRIELGEIETALKQHSLVQDVIATSRDDDNSNKKIIAYVIARSIDLYENTDVSINTQQIEQITQWQQVFDEAYRITFHLLDPTFNIAGWNSSYTGTPLQDEEMREWVEGTVTRILSLHPDRVLEIGCGTGLLLFRIAPHCAAYTGIDISRASLNYIEQQIEYTGQNFDQVTLYLQAADNLAWMKSQCFDTIILNSVVQYFPNVDYLLNVLDQAIRLTRSGGHIFLGDIRNFQLIEEFYTSVELCSAPADMSIKHLLQRVRKRIDQENELFIAPAFFMALKQRFPSVRHLQIQLKRGRHYNEMTRFRYDVILQVDHENNQMYEKDQDAPPLQLDWEEQHLTIPRLYQFLEENSPVVLSITHIPNARLRMEMQTRDILTAKRATSSLVVEELRHALQESSIGDIVDPEDLWALGDTLPYNVTINWSDNVVDGCCTLALYRCASTTTGVSVPEYHSPLDESASHQRQPWLHYANDPLQNQRKNRFVSHLRTYLMKQLPEYMVPAFIILLEAWPLTPNGKVDRRVLPSPDLASVFIQEHFVAPRTTLEHALASIWSQVLGLERIGINHNFFALGGDSIRCIQIVSRANQVGLHVTPRMVFEHQTIASLTAVVQMKTPTDSEKKSTAVIAPPDVSPFALVDQQTHQQLSGVLRNIEDAYPLSPMQQNMLAQRCYTGNTELYWLSSAPLSMRGAQLDMPAYERAWQLLVNQHPTMRTSFVWENLEEPLQIVHKQVNISIEHFDWRKLSPMEWQAQLDEYIQVKRRNGSHLSAPSHTSLTLFRVTDRDYYLLRGFNYMLQDGWSSTLLERDFEAFYEALCEGQPISLEPPRHYRDYIAWLQKQDLAKAEAFWRKKFQGLTSYRYLLGTQESTPPPAGSPFAKEVLPLSIATTTALQALARRHQMTVATFLYCAWALLLSSYSGEEDLVFGSLCSGRPTNLAGSEYMVGFFNNILPLRVQVISQTRLLKWLVELQAQMVELREYEYSSMRQIKQWVSGRDALPLFESYVVFENFPIYQYKGIGKRAQRDQGIQYMDDRKAFVPTEYPLRVEFWPFQPLQMMLSGYQEYASNTLLAFMLKQLKKILESIVGNPDQCLGDLMKIIGTE